MAGNVWEWTAGDYDKDTLVLRGGAWGYNRNNARCASRSGIHPDFRYSNIGFRCVRT